MPQILHLSSNPGRGGIAAQARDFCGELNERNRPTEILLLSSSGFDPDCRRWYEEKSVVVTQADAELERSRGLSRLRQHAAAFRKRPEALFHFHAMSPDYMDWRPIVAAHLAGKRVVVTLHHTMQWKQTRKAALAGQWLAWKLVDCFIVTTHFARDLVAERLPVRKIRIVPCAIPALRIEYCRAEARKSLNMTQDIFLISCVCRIAAYKGVFDLCQAVADLSGEFPQLQLAVVGTGPDYEELISKWGNHPAIRIMGRIDDVDTVLAASDLFAMPSHEEGFGLVYVEAAFHGVPSIACALPTVKEVVRDGETGWLIEPSDLAALKGAIREAIVNPGECRRRGERAKAHAQQFEIGHVTDRLVALYDELLASDRKLPKEKN